MPNENLKQAAADLAPHIFPNIGLLRSMSRLKGVNLKGYDDREIVDVVRMACEIALTTTSSFVFKTVYQT